MPLIALCSAKGSPGVSTLAMGLAALWPQPTVLCDLDPAGSDLLWRYRTESGAPVDPDLGLLSLGAALRRTGASTNLADHVQVLAGSQQVVAGVRHPEQITGLGAMWPVFTEALLAWPQVVLADCGRVVPGSPTVAILGRADVVVFGVRAGAEHFAQLRERLRAMAQTLHIGAALHSRIFVALICSPKDRSAVQDLQRLLDAEGLAVRVIGPIAQDESGAAALTGQWNPRSGRSLLVRSIRSVIPELEQPLRVPVQPGSVESGPPGFFPEQLR